MRVSGRRLVLLNGHQSRDDAEQRARGILDVKIPVRSGATFRGQQAAAVNVLEIARGQFSKACGTTADAGSGPDLRDCSRRERFAQPRFSINLHFCSDLQSPSLEGIANAGGPFGTVRRLNALVVQSSE